MEIAIAVFIGIWIVSAGIISYIRLERDYKEVKK